MIAVCQFACISRHCHRQRLHQTLSVYVCALCAGVLCIVCDAIVLIYQTDSFAIFSVLRLFLALSPSIHSFVHAFIH